LSSLPTPLRTAQVGTTAAWLSSLDISEKYLEGNLGLEAAIAVSYIPSLGQLGEAEDRDW